MVSEVIHVDTVKAPGPIGTHCAYRPVPVPYRYRQYGDTPVQAEEARRSHERRREGADRIKQERRREKNTGVGKRGVNRKRRKRGGDGRGRDEREKKTVPARGGDLAFENDSGRRRRLAAATDRR
ncbi:hypothetical protein GW17_00058175 [Ensete ventricosum]|nr:hypothetical protein GW17_00058175 [Ensete ventricosum]